MRCAQVQGLFSEIYDGVAEQQAGLARHLLDCPACGQEYERYCQLLDEVRQLPEPELPPGFHESIMGKIRELALSEAQDVQASGPDNKNGFTPYVVRQTHGADGRQPVARKPHSGYRSKKAASISRRWAGVAAAACVLLISLWAVRVFDLPGGRLNDSAADNMAMSEMLVGGVDAEFYRASVTEEEPERVLGATDEPMPDSVAAEPMAGAMDTPDDAPLLGAADDDAAIDFNQHMAVCEDDYNGFETAAGGAAQAEAGDGDAADYSEPEATFAPWAAYAAESVDLDTNDNEPIWQGDFDDDGIELRLGRANDFMEDEYVEYAWDWHSLDAPAVRHVETIAPAIHEPAGDEITLTIRVTQGGGISPWDIAFVSAVVVLVIALAAALLSKSSTKKSRHTDETHSQKKG